MIALKSFSFGLIAVLFACQANSQTTSPGGVGSAAAAANYQAAVTSFKDRAESVRLNGIAARAQSALGSGGTAATTFGNLILKPSGTSDLALITKGNLSVGGRPLVIDVEAKVIKPSLLGALGRFAGKVLPILGTGVALYDLTKELQDWRVKSDPQGVPVFEKLDKTEGEVCTSNCQEYWGGDTWYTSHVTACTAYAQSLGTKFLYQDSAPGGPTSYRCEFKWGGSWTFHTVPARVIPPYDTSSEEWKPESKESWASEVGKKLGDLPISKVANLIRDALQSGETVELEPPSVTGPASSPGTTSTTTNPDGSTSTTTTTNHFQYDGDNITHNTTTVTNTCVQSGSCSTTSTTTTNTPPDKSDDSEKDISVSDKSFGDIPELYKPKFPDGLTGVWTTRKAELNNSSLSSLVGVLMPPMSEAGGTCPNWQIDLDLAGFAAYGSWNVAPPCWIWDFAKAIVIISALVLARALVFGG